MARTERDIFPLRGTFSIGSYCFKFFTHSYTLYPWLWISDMHYTFHLVKNVKFKLERIFIIGVTHRATSSWWVILDIGLKPDVQLSLTSCEKDSIGCWSKASFSQPKIFCDMPKALNVLCKKNILSCFIPCHVISAFLICKLNCVI